MDELKDVIRNFSLWYKSSSELWVICGTASKIIFQTSICYFRFFHLFHELNGQYCIEDEFLIFFIILTKKGSEKHDHDHI